MTENQPHNPTNQPQFGAKPSYGSTPGEGTQPLPIAGQGGAGQGGPQQRPAGGSGEPYRQYERYGSTGASQGTNRPNPPLWSGQSGPQGPGPFGPPPIPPTQPTGPGGPGKELRRRGLAAVAVTALLVGATAGIGGAAAFSALDDSSGNTPSVTAPLNAGGAAPALATDGSVQKAAQAVLPSVVKIGVLTDRGSGSGSGIVISADGLIVTNNHVIEAAADGGRITVMFNDGRTVTGKVVGRDPLTDLAVIRAEAKGLTPAKLGASGALAVGQPVVAIGSPFGLEATVTSGIVSALNRPVTSGDGGDSTTVFPAVQTDAAINPGNSGGALIDLAGRVVGINSAIKTAGGNGQSAGNIGLGFAIPIDQAKPIIDELVAKGTATHARLGVSAGDVESTDGLQSGAAVREVVSGGAADQAGLQAGDVITAIDGKATGSGDALVANVRSHRPGDKVTINYKRGSETRTAKATLASDGGNPTG